MTAVAPPVPAAPGIDDVLSRVRSGLDRVTPQQALREWQAGALLVDTRPASLRELDGEVPGALVLERNVLEWRLDPASDARVPQATGYDLRVVVLCDEGYASSLAAASLRAIGLHRATDVEGGYQAWRAAGLPTTR